MTTLFAAFSPSRMLPLVWWQALGDSTTSHQFYAKGTGFHCGSASSSKSPHLSTRRSLDTLPVTWLTTAKDPCLCDLEILLPIYLLNFVVQSYSAQPRQSDDAAEPRDCVWTDTNVVHSQWEPRCQHRLSGSTRRVYDYRDECAVSALTGLFCDWGIFRHTTHLLCGHRPVSKRWGSSLRIF